MRAPNESRREPVFNMPGLVAGTILVLLAIHALRRLLSDVTDFTVLLDYGFVPAQWSVALDRLSATDVVNGASIGSGPNAGELGRSMANLVLSGSDPNVWSPLTYAALHVSWMHVILNCVWLAAFATPVVRRCGAARSAALAIVTALGGSFAHWLVHPAEIMPLIGASAIVSGFMAAAATFVFEAELPPAQPGSTRIGRAFTALGRLTRNRTGMVFLASWFGLNLLFGFVAQPLGVSEAGIAWEAHIGGFLVGLVVFPLVDPGWHAA